MAVAVAVTRVDNTGSLLIVFGTLTLSGNYGAGGTHGDAVDLSQIDQIKSSQVPVYFGVKEQVAAGFASTGFEFLYTTGTTLANGKLQIVGTSAAGGALVGGTEFTQGAAYSTGTPTLVGVVIAFAAFFQGFV